MERASRRLARSLAQRDAICSRNNNEAPKRASLLRHYRWKDGRNTPDVHPVLFEYANVPVYMRLTLDRNLGITRFMGFQGHHRTLHEFASSYSPQAGIDLAPRLTTASGLPSRLEKERLLQSKWHERARSQTAEKEPARKRKLSGTTMMICGRISGISSSPSGRETGRAGRCVRSQRGARLSHGE